MFFTFHEEFRINNWLVFIRKRDPFAFELQVKEILFDTDETLQIFIKMKSEHVTLFRTCQMWSYLAQVYLAEVVIIFAYLKNETTGSREKTA